MNGKITRRFNDSADIGRGLSRNSSGATLQSDPIP